MDSRTLPRIAPARAPCRPFRHGSIQLRFASEYESHALAIIEILRHPAKPAGKAVGIAAIDVNKGGACLKQEVKIVMGGEQGGPDLRHLVDVVQDLIERGIGLRVLAGQRAHIDTMTPAGRLIFGIFAALAEFESELIRERTLAGLAAARARGRKGGRGFALTKAQVRLAQAAMANRDTSIAQLCAELGVRPVTLYRYVGPNGELRDHGKRVLAA